MLKQLGYADGRDLAIDVYWADDRTERLDAITVKALARKPSVVVTASSSAIVAAKKATSRIPIVFATASAPVEQGFVASLRRPGGNITGVIFHRDLEAKVVEVIREALPAAKRVSILIHERDQIYPLLLASIEPAARRLNLETVIVRVSGAEDLGRALDEIAASRSDALLLPLQVIFASRVRQIATRARKERLPMFSAHSTAAEGGGFVSYGTLTEENYRRAAVLVDKILQGADPGELPVEQPERFRLVLNAATAKAIGLALAPALLQRADRVIE
jgi:putative tryptophan/tyrosine transport system substrate-binding protein